MIKNIYNFCNKYDIGEPPWEYSFLYNLPESEYPKYLKKIFKYRTGENLNLKHPKTFNEKIQWIKLYGVTQLMRDCTDKIKVRDYVKEKIGEEYLKPVLQIIPDEIQQSWRVIANHDSILDGEAIQRNLRKGETRVNEGIAYDSDSEVCDLPERQQIQRQEEVKQETGNENSGIKPEFQNVDCRGTQNVVVPRNDREPNDVSSYFDKIDFDKLPDSFVIKTNHGCKWQYIIKNKEKFLNTPKLIEIVKKQITGWLEQEFWVFGGFELQYRTSHRTEPQASISGARVRLSEGKVNDGTESEVNCLPERKGCQEKGITPKILIEPLLREEINTPPREIEVYCFKGNSKIFENARYTNKREITYYDENFNIIDLMLNPDDGKNCLMRENADDILKQTYDLCKNLAKNFNFVRVDWIVFNNRLYFNEFTFTPFSGFIELDKHSNEKLGSMIELN